MGKEEFAAYRVGYRATVEVPVLSAFETMLGHAAEMVAHRQANPEQGSDVLPELTTPTRVQLIQGSIPSMEMVEADTVEIVLADDERPTLKLEAVR